MHEKPAFLHKFKRSQKAVAMENTNKIKVDKDKSIDPTMLFEQFLIQQTVDIDTSDVFKYELIP